MSSAQFGFDGVKRFFAILGGKFAFAAGAEPVFRFIKPGFVYRGLIGGIKALPERVNDLCFFHR